MQVRLRDPRPADLPIFFQHQRDAEAARIAGSLIRTRSAFDAHWRGIVAGAPFIVRTVEADDEVAGYVSAFPHDGRTEIAFWLGREHRGRGIGRRALSAFLDWHRERPIFASVLAVNAPSLAILRRCGFVTVAEAHGPDGVAELTLRLDDLPAG